MVSCLLVGVWSCGEMKPEQLVGGMGTMSRTFSCWWLWWLDSVWEQDVTAEIFK